MAVRTKEELLASINSILGEDSSDETIALIEDFTDTYDSLANASTDNENWKQKHEQLDKEWRKRYRDRFLQKPDTEPTVEEEEEQEEGPTAYEDLFEVKEEK